jgi:hypothetical protein
MTTPVKFEIAKLLKEKGFDKNMFLMENKGNYNGKQKTKRAILPNRC